MGGDRADLTGDFDPGIEGLSRFGSIGSGGFSTVYVAWEAEFSRWVAVKILHRLDEGAERRFDRERSLMGRSSGHPNVITPIRAGRTDDDKPYLVMQYLEGGSLQDRVVRGEKLPWREAVTLLRPIAEALGHSHEAGILHKDVKPANILLAGNGTASLTDFGIATLRGSTTAELAFTFAHTPPEAFVSGQDARDERSDLYSLASTLYAVITGRSPFEDDEEHSQGAWLRRVANDPLPPTGLDPGLDRFLTWALAKDPADRPQDAEAFTSGLDEVLAGDSAVAADADVGTDDDDTRRVGALIEPRTVEPATSGPHPSGFGGRLASNRRLVTAVWVSLLVVTAIAVAAWSGAWPGSGDEEADRSSDEGVERVRTDSSTTTTGRTTATTTTPSSTDDATVVARPPEVQEAIVLLQDPDSDVRRLVADGVLPGGDGTGAGFSFRSCEARLLDLQAAFGGPQLTDIRDEIARWPSGAPDGYVDPAGAGRGFRERLLAYLDQTETGYQLCQEQADITLVGGRVLGGWASMQAFLCTTGVAAQVVLADGTTQACPVADELALCSDVVRPLLEDYFLAFPDRRPDAEATCRAAMADDSTAFDALSTSA